MSEIVTPNVYKHGIRQLTSGDTIISLHIDKSVATLGLWALPYDQPFTLIISDEPEKVEYAPENRTALPDSPGEANELITKKVGAKEAVISLEDQERHKKYGYIQILADRCGYSEESRRELIDRMFGKRSRTELTDSQLDDLIDHLEKEDRGEEAL